METVRNGDKQRISHKSTPKKDLGGNHPFLSKLMRGPAPVITGLAVISLSLCTFGVMHARSKKPVPPRAIAQNLSAQQIYETLVMPATGQRLVETGIGRDEKFANFKKMFSGSQLSRQDAAAQIASATGITPVEHRFALPDSLGLTTTKRMYGLDFIPIVVPEELKVYFGNCILDSYSTTAFDTQASNHSDARVKALADYILTKYRADTPEKAVEVVCSWVMHNIPLCSISSEVVSFLSNQNDRDSLLSAMGYGKTHTHKNSLEILTSTGVCIDYTNLVADLLNSIGIPARSVSAAAHGISAPNTTGSNSLSESISSLVHAILEVRLPSGVRYYETTPMFCSNGEITIALGEISSPRAYMAGRMANEYPGKTVFRIAILGDVPREFLPDNVSRILDKGLVGGEELYQHLADNGFATSLMGPLRRARYSIDYFDSFIGPRLEKEPNGLISSIVSPK